MVFVPQLPVNVDGPPDGPQPQQPINENHTNPSELVQLLYSNDQDEQLVGATGLAVLSKQKENKEQVFEGGAIPPLVHLLQTDSLEIQRQVCRALFNLSVMESVRDQITECRGLAPLLQGMKSADEYVQLNAVGAIANLATSNENKDEIVNLDGLPTLVQLIGSSDNSQVSQHACRALFALAANDHNKLAIVAAGALPALTRCLRSHSVHVQWNAAGAIANLAIEPLNKAKIVAGGALQPLITLASSENEKILRQVVRALFALAADAALRETIEREQALPALISLLHTESVEVHRNALGALGNLAMTDSLKRPILEQGALPPIIVLARSEVPAVQRQAARCLFVLSAKEDLKHYLAEGNNNALLPLVALLSADNRDTQRDSAGALANIAIGRDNKALVAASGGIPPLVRLLRCRHAYVQRQAARAVFALAGLPENQLLVVDAGGAPPLLALLSSPNDEVAKHAAGALANIASHPQAQVQLVRVGALPLLVEGAFSLSHELQKQSVRALFNLGLQGLEAPAEVGAPVCGLELLQHELGQSLDGCLEQAGCADDGEGPAGDCVFRIHGRGAVGGGAAAGDAAEDAAAAVVLGGHRAVLSARSRPLAQQFAAAVDSLSRAPRRDGRATGAAVEFAMPAAAGEPLGGGERVRLTISATSEVGEEGERALAAPSFSVHVFGVQPDAWLTLLRFVYEGEVDMGASGVGTEAVLGLAGWLGLDGLVVSCAEAMGIAEIGGGRASAGDICAQPQSIFGGGATGLRRVSPAARVARAATRGSLVQVARAQQMQQRDQQQELLEQQRERQGRRGSIGNWAVETDSIASAASVPGAVALSENLGALLTECGESEAGAAAGGAAGGGARADSGADVSLRTECGELLRAHRAVLCARCEYFRGMMMSGMRDSAQTVLAIDAPTAVAAVLLRYLYTGQWADAAHRAAGGCGCDEEQGFVFVVELMVTANRCVCAACGGLCSVLHGCVLALALCNHPHLHRTAGTC
jgi:vacuolar protein 8